MLSLIVLVICVATMGPVGIIVWYFLAEYQG